MLTPPDADLARREAALPGLRFVLDGDALLAALRRTLPDVEGPAQPRYLRYKPGTSCLAAYEVRRGGEPLLVHARAHRLDAPEKLLPGSDTAPPASPFPQAFADQGVVILAWPDDRRLPSLRRLASPGSQRPLLEGVFPDRPELWQGRAQALRYKPERRYVASWLVGGSPVAALKLHRDDAYRAASEAAKRLQSRGVLRLAARIGQSQRHGLIALEWLSGQLLETVLAQSDLAPGELAQVGAALAELHPQPAKGLRRQTREAEMDGLAQAAENLAALWPPLAERARRLALEAGRRLGETPPERSAIHGDFYARQVLLDESTVNVLDLDEAAEGDPAADLGNFVAHLQKSALVGALPEARAQAAGEALCEGYRQAGPPQVLRRVSLYAAVGLIRLAPHMFRDRQSDWPDRVEAMLARADEMLRADATARISRSPPFNGHGAAVDAQVHDPFELARRPETAFLAGALDPREAACRLGPLLSALPDARAPIRLRTIRVVRYKPGRRCLFEYEWQCGEGLAQSAFTVLGKARLKGLDENAFRLLESLWHGGFDCQSKDGVSVPTPVGVVPPWRMWLQRKVAGRSATELLPQSGGEPLARRIAEAIHKLHQAGPAPQRRHTMADELRILHERLPQVAEQRPELAERLARILDACDRLAGDVPEPQPRPIHRDFYADHVLMDGDRLILLDLDLYCEGDPALDVGNFCAHLTEQSLRMRGRPDALADREAALLDRFAELAGRRARRSAEAYATLTLVRHIHISRRLPQRRPLTERLVALCEARLGLS